MVSVKHFRNYNLLIAILRYRYKYVAKMCMEIYSYNYEKLGRSPSLWGEMLFSDGGRQADADLRQLKWMVLKKKKKKKNNAKSLFTSRFKI